ELDPNSPRTRGRDRRHGIPPAGLLQSPPRRVPLRGVALQPPQSAPTRQRRVPVLPRGGPGRRRRGRDRASDQERGLRRVAVVGKTRLVDGDAVWTIRAATGVDRSVGVAARIAHIAWKTRAGTGAATREVLRRGFPTPPTSSTTTFLILLNGSLGPI